MKRRWSTFAKAAVAGLVVSLFTAGGALAQPNLLTNGDFQADGSTVQSDFNSSTGPYDTWLSQPANWNIVNDGLGQDGAGDFYARHLQNTVRLFQGVDLAPGQLPAGTEMQLDFDFIYQSGFTGITQSAVQVLGLEDSDGPISVFLFAGDGYPPGDVLYSAALTPPLADDWTAFPTANFTLSQEYDSIAVVFTAGAFGSNTSGLRGIDNVNLHKVPEPGTLALLGSTLVAGGVFRRRFRKEA